MTIRFRARRALTCGLATACLLPAAPQLAQAKPAIAQLRVEGGGQALAPGHSFVTDTVSIPTDTTAACGGSGKTVTVPDATALGLLDDARDVDSHLEPLRVSDKFSFGLLVCGIGDFLASDTAFWLYKVNHADATVGGDQFELKGAEKVLWYFSNTAGNVNTGDELELVAPARVRAGQAFTVTVFRYSGTGQRRRARNAEVGIGQNRAVTNARGQATLGAGSNGTLTLRATRGRDIPSAPVSVCVNRRLSRCPAVRPQRIYGRAVRDNIVGTAGPDDVRARAGDDSIDVSKDDARDRVRCGSGDDVARLGRADRAAGDCERVIRG